MGYFVGSALFDEYLSIQARMASVAFGGLGKNVNVVGAILITGKGVIEVRQGCDIAHPAILLVAATMSFPAAKWKKCVGILCGLIVLVLVNVLRIMSLMTLSEWSERLWFDRAHLIIWPIAIIVLVLTLLIVWVMWVASEDAEVGACDEY